MKIHLHKSWSLTDEHPKSQRGNPILIDLGTWKIYNPTDQIGAVTAQQFVSQVVESRGENDFLPEEIQFIARFQAENKPPKSPWWIFLAVISHSLLSPLRLVVGVLARRKGQGKLIERLARLPFQWFEKFLSRPRRDLKRKECPQKNRTQSGLGTFVG